MRAKHRQSQDKKHEFWLRKEENIGLLALKHRNFQGKTSELSLKEVRCFCIPTRKSLKIPLKIASQTLKTGSFNIRFSFFDLHLLATARFTKHINLKIFWQKKCFNNVIEQREERLCLLRLSRVVTEQGEAKLWSSESRSQVYLEEAEWRKQKWQHQAMLAWAMSCNEVETKPKAGSQTWQEPRIATPHPAARNTICRPLFHMRGKEKKGELLVFPNLNSPTFCHLL